MELREIENYGLKILQEKAKDGSMTIYAKFSEAEKRNQNSRIYPLEILTREVDRVQSKIAAGQFLGQSDHSDSPATFLKNVSHVVTKLEMIGNNGYATIKILNTDAGRNCQEIIRGKGKIGISTRSVGTVDAKTGRIQKDLRLLALDLVANPSVADATIGKENILEGLEFEEKNPDDERQKELEEAVADLEKESYLGAVESGYSGTQEEWEEMCKGNIRRIMGLKESDGKTVVEKLTEGQISIRTHSYFLEACSAGFVGTFDEWKEKFPQIIEQAKAKKVVLSEKKEEPKAPFKSKTSWNEVVASGFVGSMAEWREKFPNIILEAPTSPQKPVVEKALTEKTLKQEAGRIFVKLVEENPHSSITLESVIQMLEKEEEKKTDKRIRRQAVAIVGRDVFNAGGGVDQATLEKMVAVEVERLIEERELRRERNWQTYRRLLD